MRFPTGDSADEQMQRRRSAAVRSGLDPSGAGRIIATRSRPVGFRLPRVRLPRSLRNVTSLWSRSAVAHARTPRPVGRPGSGGGRRRSPRAPHRCPGHDRTPRVRALRQRGCQASGSPTRPASSPRRGIDGLRSRPTTAVDAPALARVAQTPGPKREARPAFCAPSPCRATSRRRQPGDSAAPSTAAPWHRFLKQRDGALGVVLLQHDPAEGVEDGRLAGPQLVVTASAGDFSMAASKEDATS